MNRVVYSAVVLAILHCLLLLTLELRPGRAAIYLWFIGPRLLFVLAILVLFVGLLNSLFKRRIWGWRQLATVGLAIMTITISQTAYKVYPSSHSREISSVRFRLPFDGPVNVVWGGGSPEVNYHVGYPDQRWAYDLIVRKDGMRHSGSGDLLTNYYVYGLPVLAPADAIVHSAVDFVPDKPIGERWRGGNPAGNHVVLEVGNNQYLFLGHLKPGSIRVKAGDVVKAGQELGRVGNSGRTQVPHLHLHLQDTPRVSAGEGIPLYFYHYRLNGQIIERGMPTGGDVEQVVENVPVKS